jgi:hypothetical protein
VDDRRMARIAGGAVVEFTAEIDDLQDCPLLSRDYPDHTDRCERWIFFGLSAS